MAIHDLDNLEVDVDEVKKEVERAKNGGNTKGTFVKTQYFGGLGKNWVRLVPFVEGSGYKFLKRVSVHNGKKTGLKDASGDPMDVLCVREMFGDACVICEKRFEIGKDIGHKHALPKTLYPDDKQWGIIALIEDSSTCQTCHGSNPAKSSCANCAGTGIGDAKRHSEEKYENGKLYSCRFEFGDPSMADIINDKVTDPDWGPLYHPAKGRDLAIVISLNAGGHRQYAIDFRPNPSKLGQKLGWADGKEEEWKVKVSECIDQATAMINDTRESKLERPTTVQLAYISSFLDSALRKAKGIEVDPKDDKTLKEEESQGGAYTTPKEEESPKDPVKESKPATPEKPQETSKSSPAPVPAEAVKKAEKPAETAKASPPPVAAPAASGTVVKYADLKGLPNGATVEFSNGLKVSGPVPADMKRPEDDKRACFGLFHNFTNTECSASCDPSVAFPCMKACKARKAVG